ncbi:MAG: pyruvate kinase [Candidatus Bathyarchaeota archaeon]|nr:pyruvate kinase [Candidatus Bathyarchaeota archaeon]
MKKTKIICTIGPASVSKTVLQNMFRAGMNGARLNTAYGTPARYEKAIRAVREIADIPIIMDIKGPEIRIRAAQQKVLRKGDTFEVGFKEGEFCFNHDFYDKMAVDDLVLIDNGKIRTCVAEKANRKLCLRVLNGGVVEDGKGVNVPNKHLFVSTLSDRDIKLVELSKKLDAEYVALSFTRNRADVEKLRAQNFEGAIIAKIENSEGVENAPDILEVADGIMVARGDLGVEIEPERVPLVQKSLIKLCNQKGKLVVTATEMLESMVHQPNPTRAEVSDVANAIMDGSDAVMLSGETAVGEYPVEAVDMMSRIAGETEKAVKSNVEDTAFVNISDTVSRAIQRICQSMPVNKVVTLTRSGYTARVIARFKIAQPIIAVTPEIKVKKQLELTFGVQPVLMDYSDEKDLISAVANQLYNMHLLGDEETVLFTAGVRTTTKHASNSIEIHKIKELRRYASAS